MQKTKEWLKNLSGEYSTKFGYIVASEVGESNQITNPVRQDWNIQVWKLNFSLKVKLFMWKALHGALPVGEQLIVWNAVYTIKYCRCNDFRINLASSVPLII